VAAVASAAASAASASGASPVLELALGLGATTGAHNPIDVLVIGCQDSLQLQRERCQASF
jgi:hypothetical protein